ncbi:MAG: hypothetical protein K5840_04590 [Eubacterium sp.]|nr:hypothetical protein [Eubacterium sp.]
MGLFGAIKGAVGAVKEMREEAAAEAAANDARPSVKDLEFKPFSTAVADLVRDAKADILSGGDKKKFIKCIEERRAGYAQVAIVADRRDVMEYDMDDLEINNYYVKVADMEGRVLREDVAVVDTPERPKDYEYPDTADCADVVNVEDYPKMYVLHYFLGRKEYYMAITKKQFDNIGSVVNGLCYQYDCLRDGYDYVW